MNIGAIRADIAAALQPLGWQSYAFRPSNLQQLPAAVVAPPTSVNYALTMGTQQVVLPLELYTSSANTQDAQDRLDLALSTGNPESVHDALTSTTSTHWRALIITGASNPRQIADAVGNTIAFAIDLVISIVA